MILQEIYAEDILPEIIEILFPLLKEITKTYNATGIKLIQKIVEEHNQKISGYETGTLYCTPIQAMIWLYEIIPQLSEGYWAEDEYYNIVWQWFYLLRIELIPDRSQTKLYPFIKLFCSGEKCRTIYRTPGIIRALWKHRYIRDRMTLYARLIIPDITKEKIKEELKSLEESLRKGIKERE